MVIEQDEPSKKLQAARAAESYATKHRVEQAAIRIFAAMQSNPAWAGSRTAQHEAVTMARKLIRAIDEQCG